MEQGAVRNFEEIQERDDEPRTPRWVATALVVFGAGALAFSGVALSGRKSTTTSHRVDPLGDLIAQHAKGAAPAHSRSADITASDVTFPGILSDDRTPPTALVAVRGGERSRARRVAESPSPPVAPPVAADRLPVVPLPAQEVLEATPIVTRPRDSLTKAATSAAELVTASASAAPEGHDGGYQLQVSSFHTQPEAAAFANQLRARGHKAYVVEAHVPSRGAWYRVRVGPFASQAAAAAYRVSFEAKEHVVPFIVTPQK